MTQTKEEIRFEDAFNEMLITLRKIAGIEAWIGDTKMKELFQKTVYPAIDKASKIKLEEYASSQPRQEFGEWQLCPKCFGTGQLQPPYEVIGTSIISGTCNMCNGEMKISRPTLQPHQEWQKVIVRIDGPVPIAEDEEGYMAIIEGMPGMLETGKTKREAFEQLMIGLKVKIAYDSKLAFEPKEQSSQPRQEWVKELRDKFFKECVDEIEYDNHSVLSKKLVINTTPHNLFEWFKKEILSTAPQSKEQ